MCDLCELFRVPPGDGWKVWALRAPVAPTSVEAWRRGWDYPVVMVIEDGAGLANTAGWFWRELPQ